MKVGLSCEVVISLVALTCLPTCSRVVDTQLRSVPQGVFLWQRLAKLGERGQAMVGITNLEVWSGLVPSLSLPSPSS